jgi:ADP-ribose pyrophosphatase YjhB (NUDIX family)
MLPEALFRQISQKLPIACVDLLIQDADGLILLVKRKNEPAAGCWWFPGGRIWFKEARKNAVRRKLLEETGLKTETINEMATFDLIFPDMPEGVPSHGITSLFHVSVNHSNVKLDMQSEMAEWHSAEHWLATDLHPFMSQMLTYGLKQLNAREGNNGNPIT